MNQLYETYKDRVAFLIVYIMEAHPVEDDGTGGGKLPIKIREHQTDGERHGAAQACRAGLELKLPFVVDGIDDKIATIYGGRPDRIYIINKEGTIHYKGGKGPQGFKVREAETSLKQLL